MGARPVTGPHATLRRRAATTGVVALSLFCTMMAATLAGTAHTPVWNVAFGCVLNLVAGVGLVWRHRAPWVVLAMALAGPLFFATDATAALIALFAVASHVRDRRLVAASVAVYAACAVSLVYDSFRRRDYSVLTMGVQISDGESVPEWNVPVWVPFVVAAVLVGAVLALALLRRARSDLESVSSTLDRTTKESVVIREEMILAAERARIARDMHDTLAATLSRISLIAGGLQVSSADGPERVANTASLIQRTAHDGLDELKRIIGVLRGEGDPGRPTGSQNLDGVADLVGSARNAGVRAALVVDVAPGQVGHLCSHVTYRVVRESLTNAQRHAHGAPVSVVVRGDPATGVRVEVRNPMVPTMVRVGGTGTGLRGVAEEIRQIGGTFDAREWAGEFVVTGWLPWHS
ncbi:hypothetical protein GCM10007298_21860 [Williamsia phyllosphaerae]|uniref:histidine kinase n=2 Tax=Williamsia phyllosphaerae TaxID=885042 RepID=A0ABQ1USF8_9NOCA|nr:hypothetical protein GCM10007298_21860 [Williamsia phyllosphaerae]